MEHRPQTVFHKIIPGQLPGHSLPIKIQCCLIIGHDIDEVQGAEVEKPEVGSTLNSKRQSSCRRQDFDIKFQDSAQPLLLFFVQLSATTSRVACSSLLNDDCTSVSRGIERTYCIICRSLFATDSSHEVLKWLVAEHNHGSLALYTIDAAFRAHLYTCSIQNNTPRTPSCSPQPRS